MRLVDGAGASLDQFANLNGKPRIVGNVGDAGRGSGVCRGATAASQTKRTRFTHSITYATSRPFTVYPVPARLSPRRSGQNDGRLALHAIRWRICRKWAPRYPPTGS